MQTDIKTEVQALAESTLEDAHVLHQMMTVGDAGIANIEEEYGLDDDADWLDLLDVLVLEMYGNATVRAANGPRVFSVTLVTGTGGPHTEIEVRQTDDVIARAIWGSDVAERYDRMPGLFDTLHEMIM